MMSTAADIGMGSVEVHTTSKRGASPEEVAKRCVDKIVSVSDNANPLIQQQARAFKENIHKVVEFYVRKGIEGYKTDLYNEARKAGDDSLAKIIRRL